MSFETLLYSLDEGVATITLNRPDSLNTIVPFGFSPNGNDFFPSGVVTSDTT